MILYTLAFVAGAAIAVLFVSQADSAHETRAWLRRQTLGRLCR